MSHLSSIIFLYLNSQLACQKFSLVEHLGLLVILIQRPKNLLTALKHLLARLNQPIIEQHKSIVEVNSAILLLEFEGALESLAA